MVAISEAGIIEVILFARVDTHADCHGIVPVHRSRERALCGVVPITIELQTVGLIVEEQWGEPT